jgi:hypothetical protein
MTDYEALKAKGYSKAEIRAILVRDAKAGRKVAKVRAAIPGYTNYTKGF